MVRRLHIEVAYNNNQFIDYGISVCNNPTGGHQYIGIDIEEYYSHGDERYHLHIYHMVSYGLGISEVLPDHIK